MHQSPTQQRVLEVAGHLQKFQSTLQKWHDSCSLCIHCFLISRHISDSRWSISCYIHPLVLGHDFQTRSHNSTPYHTANQSSSIPYNMTCNLQYFHVPHGWRGLISLCPSVLADPQNTPRIHQCSKVESMPQYCCLRHIQMTCPSMSQPSSLQHPV